MLSKRFASQDVLGLHSCLIENVNTAKRVLSALSDRLLDRPHSNPNLFRKQVSAKLTVICLQVVLQDMDFTPYRMDMYCDTHLLIFRETDEVHCHFCQISL